MFLHLSVILFTGGGCLPHPHWEDTHLARHPPRQTSPLHSACWDMVNKQAVRILLECIPVAFRIYTKTRLQKWVELWDGFPACIIGHMTREGLHPGGGGSASRGWWVCIQGAGGLHPGGTGMGVCIQGEGGLPTGGGWADAPPAGTRKADGTHPMPFFQFHASFRNIGKYRVGAQQDNSRSATVRAKICV